MKPQLQLCSQHPDARNGVTGGCDSTDAPPPTQPCNRPQITSTNLNDTNETTTTKNTPCTPPNPMRPRYKLHCHIWSYLM